MGMTAASGTKSGTKGGRGAGVSPTMNVTPLVDVVLVLLIILMVVAPLLVKQMWLELPKAAVDTNPTGAGREPFVLRVGADGAVRLGKRAIDARAVTAEVARELPTRAGETLLFEADDAAPYALAVEVLDAARKAGAKKLAVLTTAPRAP
jgi:biopolymer transport protein TolR